MSTTFLGIDSDGTLLGVAYRKEPLTAKQLADYITQTEFEQVTDRQVYVSVNGIQFPIYGVHFDMSAGRVTLCP